MMDALRRAMIAAGVDPDQVAVEAAAINLNAPRKGDRQPAAQQTLQQVQQPEPEQLGLDVGVATGIVKIRPGTQKHESLRRLRGTSLETNEIEFLQEFQAADLVARTADGWTLSHRGEAMLGMLDYGSTATAEKGKGVVPDRSDAVRAVREEAIARADRPPSSEWKAHAAEVIEATARAMPFLTSEDVWNHGLRQPDAGSPDGDALGPAMRRAKDAGIIEPTERTTTSTNRPQRHNNPKRVWRSLVYEP